MRAPRWRTPPQAPPPSGRSHSSAALPSCPRARTAPPGGPWRAHDHRRAHVICKVAQACRINPTKPY
eukprot:1928408-Pyramimonas_sp.AAC.1